ncbi:MAG: dipeptidase [Bacteroidales bacterium]|nr:dipeptidase [Bacteroidales bacterium]
MIIVDSHCDTPSQIIRLRDLSKDNHHSHVDFPKLKAGGVDAAFFALYTTKNLTPDQATRYALEMIAGINDSIEANSDKVALARETEDIIRNKENGLTSILIGMENGAPIQKSLSLLRQFNRLGVRYVTLSHNGDNAICDAAAEGNTWHGLSPFGKEVVAEMNRLGMIVDIAHASDETFYDCIKYSKAPIVSTHSCCRALASHRRNLTDDMLRALAQNGGVCQINFYPTFLSDDFAKAVALTGLEDKADDVEVEFIKEPWNPEKIKAWHEALDALEALERPSYKVVVDHIDHAVQVAGIDHVGIGSDFDGISVTPKGLENVSKIGIVFEEMRARGYSEEDICKVAGGNFMRIMDITKMLAR